ncbi:hypothetical protein [Photorhabdus akhurstii]|uniref:hypothetical protein n=1 Tax=Photorhabdus akhurstii TaxID=171438 RepID=UPI00370422BF
MDTSNNLYKKVKIISKRTSAFAATIASYAVVNGLVWFFGIRVSCKYPDFTNIAENICAAIIAALYLVFMLDFCTNYISLKYLKLEKKNIIPIILYFLTIAAMVLASWAYITSIYQPLFSFSKEIYQCTR